MNRSPLCARPNGQSVMQMAACLVEAIFEVPKFLFQRRHAVTPGEVIMLACTPTRFACHLWTLFFNFIFRVRNSRSVMDGRTGSSTTATEDDRQDELPKTAAQQKC